MNKRTRDVFCGTTEEFQNALDDTADNINDMEFIEIISELGYAVPLHVHSPDALFEWLKQNNMLSPNDVRIIYNTLKKIGINESALQEYGNIELQYDAEKRQRLPFYEQLSSTNMDVE